MTVIDFEAQRATRRGRWTSWAHRQPETDVVIRLRGREGLYVRRTAALCQVEPDGSLLLMQPPYEKLEWMPG